MQVENPSKFGFDPLDIRMVGVPNCGGDAGNSWEGQELCQHPPAKHPLFHFGTFADDLQAVLGWGIFKYSWLMIFFESENHDSTWNRYKTK